MRNNLTLAALLLVVLAAPTQGQERGVNAIRWLASCWEMSSGTRRVVERWAEPSAGEMRGSSRTIVGSREIEGERLRIYAAGDTLVYDARPSGQAPTEFRGRATSANEIVFENPAHDFPQRIAYRRVGSDSLIARIEGDRSGRRSPVTYAYRRVECSGFTPSAADLAESELQLHYRELDTLLDASPLGLNAWFAKYSRPDFNYVFWATAGYRPPVVTREQVDRVTQNPAAASTLTDRTNDVAIERALIRGDTAEVLVTLNMAHRFLDTQGRYGTAGERRARAIVQRRLDRWIRAGDQWQLSNAALISDQISVEGRVVLLNGRAP